MVGDGCTHLQRASVAGVNVYRGAPVPDNRKTAKMELCETMTSQGPRADAGVSWAFFFFLVKNKRD